MPLRQTQNFAPSLLVETFQEQLCQRLRNRKCPAATWKTPVAYWQSSGGHGPRCSVAWLSCPWHEQAWTELTTPRTSCWLPLPGTTIFLETGEMHPRTGPCGWVLAHSEICLGGLGVGCVRHDAGRAQSGGAAKKCPIAAP
mgnify:CR=1 FL=1